MNELDLLSFFYDELRAEGRTRENLFISLDESVAAKLSQKLRKDISVGKLHYYADICIANEWLERTTADPAYQFLSLTEAGLQIAINNLYIA